MTGIFPSIICPKAYNGRERFVAAFVSWLDKGHYSEASPAIRGVVQDLAEQSHDDIARILFFYMSVATVNTAPVIGWMVMHILADDNLRGELRKELLASLQTSNSTGGEKTVHIDLSRPQDSHPLLVATYQEALRLGSLATANREVMDDMTTLDAQTGKVFTMKRGVRVSVPTWILHRREDIWGDDAAEFNPYRFLGDAASNRVRTGHGYLPYGGGVHYCPGRHFAKAEILAVAGLLIAALDIEPLHDGKFELPKDAPGGGSRRPATDVMVKVRKVAQWEGAHWSVNM
jgi:cytochrome P450